MNIEEQIERLDLSLCWPPAVTNRPQLKGSSPVPYGQRRVDLVDSQCFPMGRITSARARPSPVLALIMACIGLSPCVLYAQFIFDTEVHYSEFMGKCNKLLKKTSGHQLQMGARLKALRQQRKLTLEQLSKMADVSKAMLSRTEQGKVNPTIIVMLRITRALQTSMSDLLAIPVKQGILRKIPSNEKAYTFRSDLLCNIRTLSPLNLEKTVEFYRINLEPTGKLDSEPHFPGTEEILYLAKGRLDLISGGQTTKVNKGDSVHYRADVNHSLRNVGKSQVDAYMIVRYREE